MLLGPFVLHFRLFSKGYCLWLFDLQYLADWKAIRYKCHHLVNNSNDKENANISHDYAIGDYILIINKGLNHEARDRYI